MKDDKIVETTQTSSTDKTLTQILDRGIDDMESGRELPVDEAFTLIAELVERRQRARA